MLPEICLPPAILRKLPFESCLSPAIPLQLLEAKLDKLEAGGIKSTAVLDLRKDVQSALAASKKVGMPL